jgi:hypothetical protein
LFVFLTLDCFNYSVITQFVYAKLILIIIIYVGGLLLR